MQKKKQYIQPTAELHPAELSTTILSGSDRPSGYAIDNTTADDSQIISITEQEDDVDLWDSFLDID